MQARMDTERSAASITECARGKKPAKRPADCLSLCVSRCRRMPLSTSHPTQRKSRTILPREWQQRQHRRPTLLALAK